MLSPGMVVDQFEVTRFVGKGACGWVFLAKDKDRKRDVAIKIIDPVWMKMTEFSERVQREARELARFRHPNIVQLYQCNQWEDTCYLAMEYVPRSLAQKIGEVQRSSFDAPDGETVGFGASSGVNTKKQTLTLDETLQIIWQVCQGVREAHSYGVIHRDIKPDNILLTETDQVKICDFGIAHVLHEERLTTAGPIGTQNYSSPEQMYPDHFPNHAVDVRADVYGVCAVFYRLVSGLEPLPAGTPKYLGDLVPHIPTGICDVIMRGLSWKPEDRFQDLSKLAEALLPSNMRFRHHASERQRSEFAGQSQNRSQFDARKSDKKKPAQFDLSEMSQKHASRLTQLGFEVPENQGLVICNDQDGGIALWMPEGTFLYGQGELQGKAKVEKDIQQDFYFDQYPITNAQYARFVLETGHRAPACDDWGQAQWNTWKEGRLPTGYEDHPVVGVSWDDAMAYCKWSGKRLALEEEWEYGARGLDGREYPWGDEAPSDQHANFDKRHNQTSRVGSFAKCMSPFGLYDMAGNVWEWTASYFLENKPERVLRGGSWSTNMIALRCKDRFWDHPNRRVAYIGFRCITT